MTGMGVAVTGATPSARARHTVRRIGVWLILALIAVSTLYPLIFTALTMSRTDQDYYRSPLGVPSDWTGENIAMAVGPQRMLHFALNSLLVVVPAVLLIATLACLAAYALTLFEFPMRGGILVAVVAMMAVPQTVLIVPMFRVVLDIGLLNNRLGLVLAYSALSLPFAIYLLSSYMRSVPRELLHAAAVDGAGPLRVLWTVVLPLVRPGLLTLMVLNFVLLWNDLLFSLVILQREEARTVMVAISQITGAYGSVGVGPISAALIVSMLPPLILLLVFQQRLAQGLTAGAVK